METYKNASTKKIFQKSAQNELKMVPEWIRNQKMDSK